MTTDIEITESADAYRTALRAPVRALWMGVFTLDQFLDAFGAAIEQGLTRAWIDGAGECGIRFDELSSNERATLKQHILMQRLYMGRYGESIVAAQKGVGKLTNHFARLETWVNRWNEVRNVAAAMACKDKKVKWQLNLRKVTKVHCISCSTFHDRVYRYSTWLENGALPQSRRLACGGFRCGCGFVDTDERITPGRFPSSVLQ